MASSIVYNYKSTNFVAKYEPNDKYIRLYDKNKTHKYSLTPLDVHFYYKNRFLYIRQDGYNNIVLDFIDEPDAARAMAKLNEVKAKFYKSGTVNRDYYTKEQLDNGQLDNRYYNETEADNRFVNVDGDTMDGDLVLSTLSGDSIVNMNIDELGKIIKGNQSLYNLDNITSSQFIDSFSKNIDFSVFWEYAVKDISSGINIRAGNIVAVWDDVNNKIVFSHTSTMDIGDTSGIDFVVDMDGGNTLVRLFANISNGNWRIKVLRRFV
jgi:hypothetical protein